MARKKNYWYVLVLTTEGPVLVTDIDHSTKWASWDRYEKTEGVKRVYRKRFSNGAYV